MFRILMLVASFYLTSSAQESDLKIIMEDWHQARDLASKQNKMLLVGFYTDWCNWCKKMKNETFPDSAVTTIIKEHFILLFIDAEKGLGVRVGLKYRITDWFPSYGYLTPDGRLISKSVGYASPAEYVETLKEVVDLHERGSYLKGVSSYLNPGFPDFYLTAGGAPNERIVPEQAVVDDYLSTQDDLFSEVSFSVIYRFTTADRYTDFFLENRDKYIELFGKDDVEVKTSLILYHTLKSAIKEQDENLIERAISISERYEGGDPEKIRDWYTMAYYNGIKDWKAYSELVDEALQAERIADEDLNSAAWVIYQECEDMDIILQAIDWMKQAVTSKPNYSNLEAYTVLLFKGGKRTLAEEYALKAIEKGKAENQDIKAVEELLSKSRSKGH